MPAGAADVASILKKDRQIDRKDVRLNGNAKQPPADARPQTRTAAEEATGTNNEQP